MASAWVRSLAVGGLLLTVPIRALAQERPGARLHYGVKAGAEGCPGDDAMRGAVAARLGYAVFETPQPRFDVRVEIRADRDALVAELSIAALDVTHESAPPRVFRASRGHCDELLESAATTVAMTLDPSALFGPRRSEPLPLAAAPPAQICPAPLPCPVCVDPELRERPQSESPVHVDAAVGGGAAWLGLPAVAPQLQLEVGVRVERFRAALSGVVTAVSKTDDASQTAAQLAYGTLALCAVPAWGPSFRVDVCALGSAGGLTASRPNLRLESTRITAAVGGRAQVEVAITEALFVRGSLDAQLALTRHRLELEGALLWTSPALWLGTQLALGVRFS